MPCSGATARSCLLTPNWLAVALLSGLAAGSEHGGDLSPGVSVFASRGDCGGKFNLVGCFGADRGTDTADVARVGIGGGDGLRIERVKPTLSVIGGLLELFASKGACFITLVRWSEVVIELWTQRHRVDRDRLAVVV